MHQSDVKIGLCRSTSCNAGVPIAVMTAWQTGLWLDAPWLGAYQKNRLNGGAGRPLVCIVCGVLVRRRQGATLMPVALDACDRAT